MPRPFLTLCLATAALTAADPTAPATTSAKPAATATVPGLPEVEGVSREQLLKFRRAAAQTAADPEILAARAKIQEIRKQAEFASDDEKKSMRSELEATVDRLVEVTRAAIAKADPSLSRKPSPKSAKLLRSNSAAAPKRPTRKP